ncbi:MAG: hypothetical protein SWO11_21365 [Thermodesulfobacteriota bacterium]|nr:hypothetical protein [Thermodesulfobacteriota bacterium]
MSFNLNDQSRPIKNGLAFTMHDEAYSIYWRKNISHIETNELVLALRALRKVAAHIGTNVKPILWSGMSAIPNNSILLDPAEIRGRYPIPFKKMDLLVAEVVRESLCCIEWGDWVKDQVEQKALLTDEKMKDFLSSFLIAAEDIYIDQFVRHSVWSLYLSSYWKSMIKKKQRDPSLPPGPSSLANVWRDKVFLGNIPVNFHPYYEKPLRILFDYEQSIKELIGVPTLSERRNKRADLYLEMWNLLYQVLLEWEEFIASPDGVPIQDEAGPKVETPEEEGNEQREGKKEDVQEEDSQGLDEDLADKINFELDEGEADLTKHISVAVEDPEAKQMETIFSRAVARCNVCADQQQAERLRKIFKKQMSLIRILKKKRARRGVDMGKLDSRRLYRVPLDGKIFKVNDISDYDYSWSISIVADASASMGGKDELYKPWTVAEQTFVSLTEAAKGFINQVEVFGYQEQSGRCNLVRLYQRGKLYTVYPTGRTPSGQAIMGAAHLMRKDNRRKLIIHITDGAANCGLNVLDAIQYCHKCGIDLVTIGCGCNIQTEQFLMERYPKGTVYLMDDIRGLSAGLERLFKKKLLRFRFN